MPIWMNKISLNIKWLELKTGCLASAGSPNFKQVATAIYARTLADVTKINLTSEV